MRLNRIDILILVFLGSAIGSLCSVPAFSGPTVAFDGSGQMAITANTSFHTPSIYISGAAGVTKADLIITIPNDILISEATNATGLACVEPGGSVESGSFFSEWNASTRTISITCNLIPSATIEVVRFIAFGTSASPTNCNITLGGSLTGGSGTALFSPLQLIAPHSVTLTSSVSPGLIASGASVNCTATGSDNLGHALDYVWSDNGAGGVFAPGATSQNPTYTPANNYLGATISITLTCRANCRVNTSAFEVSTSTLMVQSLPPNTISITSTPNAGAAISFSPNPDDAGKVSPLPAKVVLNYYGIKQGITISAARQDGSARPLWFDHWVLDNVDQPSGQVSITLNMSTKSHTAVAVYSKAAGDLDGDGHVNKADALILLKAVLGSGTVTLDMDVDMNGVVDSRDAEWMLKHSY